MLANKTKWKKCPEASLREKKWLKHTVTARKLALSNRTGWITLCINYATNVDYPLRSDSYNWYKRDLYHVRVLSLFFSKNKLPHHYYIPCLIDTHILWIRCTSIFTSSQLLYNYNLSMACVNYTLILCIFIYVIYAPLIRQDYGWGNK